MFCQPSAYRRIVELEGCPCDEDGDGEEADGCQDVRSQRRVQMTVHPAGVHVGQRIVGDVEREGDVAQELADGCRFLSFDGAAGAQHEHDGENDEHADELIGSVDDFCFASQHGIVWNVLVTLTLRRRQMI